MKIIKKIKSTLGLSSKKDGIENLTKIINSLVDSIEVRDGVVHIKTNKNIIIENDGHLVTVNNGLNVTLAKQIHLNPKINFDDNDFKELQQRLDEAQIIEQKKNKNKGK